jgi:hypothetical protein
MIKNFLSLFKKNDKPEEAEEAEKILALIREFSASLPEDPDEIGRRPGASSPPESGTP